MEKLGSIVAARSSGSQIVKQRGERHSRETLRQLQNLLMQMSAAFPHQEASPETARIWRMAFEDLAEKYTLPRVELALRAFLTKQKFFPHPAEVAEELEAMSKKSQAEANKHLPPLGCNLCHDGGWAPGYILREVKGKREVQECACLVARRIAKENAA